MICEYKVSKKRIVTPLAFFFTMMAVLVTIVWSNMLRSKMVLEKYMNISKNDAVDLGEFSDIFRNMQMRQLEGRYHMWMMGIVFILAIGLFFFFIYFLNNRRLIFREENISVYSFDSKRPKTYDIESIKTMSFSYGKTDKGLFNQYIMELELHNSNDKRGKFIHVPIQNFYKYEDMFSMAKKLYPHVNVKKVWNLNITNKSFIEIIKEAYVELKSHMPVYLAYGLIICGFSLTTMYVKLFPVNIIALIAYVYFSIKAEVAINYKAYSSYRGYKVDFQEAWDYSVGRVERYFEATVIRGLIVILGVIIAVFLMISTLEIEYKILLGVTMALMMLIVMSKIYLFTYVNSIIDMKKSYVSLSTEILRSNFKKVLCIVCFHTLTYVPAMYMIIRFWPDKNLIQEYQPLHNTIYNAIFIFLNPFIRCVIMNLISESYRGDNIEKNFEQ